jgi:isopentenyl diphosphate isomerase/L-lactate dehydrogenase-like FMN-dependent dehydrogenase
VPAGDRGRGQESPAAASDGRARLPGHRGRGEYTLRRNRAAFDLLEFQPGTPRDVSQADTSTTVLGQRIRGLWDGPILVKGVMRAEEAIRAAELGLDGVIVSNHGGRQLDHVPATIDVLPEIVGAAGDRLEVLIDSGFRRGSDIAAALALGARAVLIGRAHLYGLAAAGEAGVRHCIDILAQELRMTMRLCGARSIAELNRGLIRRREPLPRSPSSATPAGA